MRQDVDQKQESFWVNPSLSPQRPDHLPWLQLSIHTRRTTDEFTTDSTEILTAGLIWRLNILTRGKLCRFSPQSQSVQTLALQPACCANYYAKTAIALTENSGIVSCGFKSQAKALASSLFLWALMAHWNWIRLWGGKDDWRRTLKQNGKCCHVPKVILRHEWLSTPKTLNSVSDLSVFIRLHWAITNNLYYNVKR